MRLLPVMLAPVFALALTVVPAQGAIIVTGDDADYDVKTGSFETTAFDTTRPNLRAGRVGNDTRDAVFIFELPVITAAIQTADLSFQLLSTQGFNENALNADLKGEGIDDSPSCDEIGPGGDGGEGGLDRAGIRGGQTSAAGGGSGG